MAEVTSQKRTEIHSARALPIWGRGTNSVHLVISGLLFQGSTTPPLPFDDGIFAGCFDTKHVAIGIMLKKPTLFCSCGALHAFGQWPITSSVAQPASISPPQRKQNCLSQCSKRFAHVRGSYQNGPEADMSWPSTPTFTPYDIFKQSRTEPYSKRRYYDLVKVYHPDMCNENHPLCKGVPEAVRLHRYRLIVAAHEILSDPTKKEAYDRFGLGWHQRSELFAEKFTRNLDPRYGRTTEVDPSIYRNATWEDWDRYYKRHDRNQSQASTVSHGTFASFLILLMLLGGVGQAVTIGNYSSQLEERVKEVDEKCGKMLNGRRQQTIAQMNSQDARLQSFLKRRDPSGCGLKQEEEETYREFFTPPATSNAPEGIDKPLPPPPPSLPTPPEMKKAGS
ncbi:hypothetical protein AJ79_00660 [Helicocarpus griseus UAMH5409]|uniref:J domain-containing protein n=1 Tax=Helicocarpus griseus UAMH5409 TaxID=1447875 RepID=A0A2B7Y1S3_9EURO|nr:hypothetical protein AJ79_00660 [Helicocarpus griseus UAMH5409]